MMKIFMTTIVKIDREKKIVSIVANQNVLRKNEVIEKDEQIKKFKCIKE